LVHKIQSGTWERCCFMANHSSKLVFKWFMLNN
jgi:hypothetical protein